MKPLFTGVFALVLVGFGAMDANAQSVKLGEWLVFQHVAEDSRAVLGLQQTRVRKDRGPHVAAGEAVVWTGTTGGSTPEAPSGTVFTSYRLIGPSTLAPLPNVDLLGIHYLKVRPDRSAAFEKFVAEKLNPAVGNLRPDLRLLYYKATAGRDAGSYITVFALTKASRDKYWPGGQDSDDLKAAFTPAVKALATELQGYLVDGTWGTGMTAQVFEAKEWADWVVVGR